MYRTVRQQVKHLSKEDYNTLKDLCHIAKNLLNQAVYNIRQYYFAEHKYLSYGKNYAALKPSENYRALNSNMAQQIIMQADENFKSFFGLLRLAEKGSYSKKACRLPGYLPKNGYTPLIIGFVRTKGSVLTIPFSNSYSKTHHHVSINMPPILGGKNIKEIRIVPRSDARFFEIQYTYEEDDCVQENLDKNNALALDLGVDNLLTAVSSLGGSFIIDGRPLKAVNQWFNKQMAFLQSVKDKQGADSEQTRRQVALTRKRNNRVDDHITKAALFVVRYCVSHNCGTLIMGCNEGFQKHSRLGRVGNQNFVNIPYGKLRRKLKYLCEMHGIDYIEQEESYTSKASFWSRDYMPVYGEEGASSCTFSGRRIHRGLYENSDGSLMNADVNGALNIMRKSNVVSLEGLYARGEVDTPVRIRVA